jgi:DNA-binding transcriptional ArsR family regulator
MDTLQLIADKKRRAILEMVWDEPMSAGAIADRFDVTFGAISQHLGKLRKAGLVDVERDGNQRFYRANVDDMGAIRPLLESLWVNKLESLAKVAEDEA